MVELHLDPVELSTATTGWKMNRGLSYQRYKCPNSDGHQGCLLARGGVAEARLVPSCLLELEFYYTLASQEILPSKQPGCHPWHRESTTLDRPNDPRQTPQDVQIWDSCQMCVGRWCPGTPHLALSTSCNRRAGTKIQIPSQLHFYLKDMGKHLAQNLLSSAPLCLEAEGVFAE